MVSLTANMAELRGINAKVSEYGAAVGLAALDEWSATRAAYLSLRQEYVLALAGLQYLTLAPDSEGDGGNVDVQYSDVSSG